MTIASSTSPTSPRDPSGEILDILRGILPEGNGPYALHEPELTSVERNLICQVLDEGFVSYAGRQVGLFEKALAAACGTKRAVAVVSGTAAIEVTFRALGIGDGDEVLCPALTFVATANAITHAGATPHFVDSNENDFGIDPDRLEAYLERIAEIKPNGTFNRVSGRRMAAILPVHIFGHVGQLTALRELAERWNLTLVEDAAEAFGSRDRDGLLFRSGPAATLSFNGNKIVTTGGGGAILTDDEELADRLCHLTTTAKVRHPWHFNHDAIGFNYRMPNLNAALGLAQVQRLPDMLARKRALAVRYRAAFANALNWTFSDEPDGDESNFWLNAVRLKTDDAEDLDRVLADLHEAGYSCRPCWTPMHLLEIYAAAPRDELPVSERLAKQLLCLPSSPHLMGPPSDV